MISLFDEPVYWVVSHDMNPKAQELADRHYSRKTPGSKKGFIGPGEKLVLLSPTGDALFTWLRSRADYRGDKIDGVNCTIFRNEGSVLSSKLILEAEKFAHDRWPGLKLFTYVSKAKVKSKNPGWCFMKAGWKLVGENKSGELRLLVKEALK
jgi:hypothetical protein